MSFWTTTKTALALVSIGILITPVLRRLGYLPPEDQQVPVDAQTDADGLQIGSGATPPDLGLPGNGAGEQSSSRH